MAPSPDLEARIAGRLRELDARGLRRHLCRPTGIDFSSNDYLNLSVHPRVKQHFADEALRGGCGATASRLLRGERQLFADVERRFAAFKETEASLYFSSGYLANLGVLTSLLEAGDVVFSDELNHASLIDGLRLAPARRVIFPHRDVSALRRLMEQEGGSGQKFVVTESLFSMDGDIAPLAEYAALCRAAGAALIVDEAHAVGVFGGRGTGLIEAAGVAGDVLVSINTAGKALGVAGAFVSGPGWVIEYLVQKARTFIFSTAPPPAVAAALMAAISLVEEEPERRANLLARAASLRRGLIDAGLPVPSGESQIIPVVLGENDRAVAVASALQEAGYDVRAIRPPTVPPGTARLRLSINVGLEESTLREFASTLTRVVATKKSVAL